MLVIGISRYVFAVFLSCSGIYINDAHKMNFLLYLDRPTILSEISAMFVTCQKCSLIQRNYRWRELKKYSTSIKSVLGNVQVGSAVTVTGWINNRRKLKNATFLDVTDGSTFQTLQVVASQLPETYGIRGLC